MMVRKNISWKSGFSELFNDSLKYIFLQKKYIYFVVFLFFVSSVFGYFNSESLGFLDESLRDIAKKTEGLDAIELTWFIFSNNVTSAITSFFLGALLGILPIFSAISNGTLLGYVYSKASAIAGFGIIWRLFPHGIFELPAIFISLALGIHLGMSLFSKDKVMVFRQRFAPSFNAFLTVVVPLLMIAAIIEGFLIFLVG